MNSKKHRSASIYLFVIETWIEYLFLTKFKKKFYSEPKYDSIRIHFLKRKGKETKHLFFAMGGVYIKIGQFVSNLFHILPEEFLWELQDLQDKIPPREFEEINERWLYDYKKSMDTIFTDLDKTSYASASTAQVHIGYYNGKKVAIKTLYPKIEEDAIRDLKTISRVIWLIDRFVFKVSAKEVNEQLNTMIRSELDLRSELKNLKYTKQLFALEKDFFSNSH